jgi:predicted nucleic acid-binding protein
MKKVNRIGIPPRLKICRDPKDDAYLSLAKAVHADYLVTGDSDLLSLTRQDLERAGLSHLVITSPRGFLDQMSP